MSHTRLAALVATLSCALLLGAAGSAAAQTSTPTLAKQVPISGVVKKTGKKFNGTFTIQRFQKSGDSLVAVGRLTTRLKHRRVSKVVSLPADVVNQGATTAQVPVDPKACQILNLVLGPINLNLLGLRVRTNQINLVIDAVPGAGNLLGNLLCGITGLLDPPALANTPLGQLAQILNALLALSPRT
jgi:hypothetical protein